MIRMAVRVEAGCGKGVTRRLGPGTCCAATTCGGLGGDASIGTSRLSSGGAGRAVVATSSSSAESFCDSGGASSSWLGAASEAGGTNGCCFRNGNCGRIRPGDSDVPIGEMGFALSPCDRATNLGAINPGIAGTLPGSVPI